MGQYALSSRRYEVGEKDNLLDAHVSKSLTDPIKLNFSQYLTNMLVKMRKKTGLHPMNAPLPLC